MGRAVWWQAGGITSGLMTLVWGCGDAVQIAPASEAKQQTEMFGRTSHVVPGECPEQILPSSANVSSLLDEARYAELEELLTSLERAYESNARCEAHVWLTYWDLGEADEERLAALARWAEARPDSHQAHLARAEALKDAGYAARGRRSARKTPAQDVSHMGEYFRAAVEELDAVESIRPNHMLAVATALRILQASGSTDEAEKVANRYLEHDPLNYIVRARLVSALDPRWGGSFADVQRVAEAAQAYADRNPRLRVLLGYEHAHRAGIAAAKGQQEEVVEHYTRALAFGDAGITWTLGRARANKYAGRLVQASQDATRALKIHPDDVYALTMRGWIRKAAKAQEKALEDLNRAIELDPRYSWARELRGRIHQGARRWQEAVTDYEIALQGDPNDSWVLRQTGYLYLRWLKKPGKALAPLLQATRLEPDDRFNWYYLALAQERTSDSAAAESYRRYLSMAEVGNPSDTAQIATARKYLDPNTDAGVDTTTGAPEALPGIGTLEAKNR